MPFVAGVLALLFADKCNSLSFLDALCVSVGYAISAFLVQALIMRTRDPSRTLFWWSLFSVSLAIVLVAALVLAADGASFAHPGEFLKHMGSLTIIAIIHLCSGFLLLFRSTQRWDIWVAGHFLYSVFILSLWFCLLTWFHMELIKKKDANQALDDTA